MPSPDRAISPPPLKRRRISDTPPQQPHPSPHSPPTPPPPIPTSNAPSPSSQTTLRIFSWNINGIHPFLPPSTPPITAFLKPTSPSSNPLPPPPSLRANLKRWTWPHILCLQEVKIAPADTTTRPAIQRAINKPLDQADQTDPHRPLYDAHFCLPQDKYNATGFGGKVYGVCTLVRRDVPDYETKTVEWDLEGRVLLTEIRTWRLVLINVYAVNGTTNDYRDPTTGKVIGDRHSRKRIFHSLLRDEICAYEEKAWHVVVAGDMNISRSPIDSFPRLRMGEEHVRNRADFEEKLVEGLGLVDTFREVNGARRKFTFRP
ncbi:Endonuclease/exonuclease/phosphatase, partial [Usnea florida]